MIRMRPLAATLAAAALLAGNPAGAAPAPVPTPVPTPGVPNAILFDQTIIVTGRGTV